MYIINPEYKDEIPEGYKECTKCHRIMPLVAFHYYKPKAKIKKYRPECIECERFRNALKRAEHNMESPNYWNNYMKEWYKTKENPEQREQRRQRNKKSQKSFLERHPNYSKEYYLKHREHILQLQKEGRKRRKNVSK